MQYYFHHSIFYLIKIISSLQLLLMQYCFHHSSFCLYSILFIIPASISTIFFSSIQLLVQLRVIFKKSHFCWRKQLSSSFQLLFTQRFSVRGHPFMTSTKNHVFDTPLSTCVHMGRTSLPLVEGGGPAHTVDMKYTPLS